MGVGWTRSCVGCVGDGVGAVVGEGDSRFTHVLPTQDPRGKIFLPTFYFYTRFTHYVLLQRLQATLGKKFYPRLPEARPAPWLEAGGGGLKRAARTPPGMHNGTSACRLHKMGNASFVN